MSGLTVWNFLETRNGLVGTLLVRLNSHELHLRGTRLGGNKQLLTNHRELEAHESRADHGDGDDDKERLSVELDEPEPGGTVEGPPGLDEDCTGSATLRKIQRAEDGVAVEGDDGALVLREKRGFDARESHGSGKEDAESGEDGSQRDSKETHHEQSAHGAGSIRLAAVTVVGVHVAVVHLLREAESKSDGDREDDGGLLSDRENKRWQKDGLALLARHEAAEPGLRAGRSDHGVGPGHVQTRGTEGGEDGGKPVAHDTEANKAGKTIGHKSVGEVVEHAQAESPPAAEEATGTVQKADGAPNVRSDGLVVDHRDLNILVCRCFGGQEKLLLQLVQRSVGLVGVGWRLGLDDGGGGRRLDNSEGSDNFAEGVAHLRFPSAYMFPVSREKAGAYGCDQERHKNARDDYREELHRADLALGPSLLIQLRILLQLLNHLWTDA